MSNLTDLLAKFKKGPSKSTSVLSSPADSEKRDDLIAALKAFRDDRARHIHFIDTTASIDVEASGCLQLCFIIIDTLPHELIWRTWLRHGGMATDRVKITIHAKYPSAVSSDWVRERLVPFNLCPSWGSIDLTAVMIKHLEHAVEQDPEQIVSKFCFISESCVPIAPLQDLLTAVLREKSSWINYSNTQNDGYAWQLQFAPLMKILPSECVYKADQWVMLNRSDTELLLSAPTLLNGLLKEHSVTSNPSDATSILRSLFKKASVTDEMYVASMLALMGLLYPHNPDGARPEREVCVAIGSTETWEEDVSKIPDGITAECKDSKAPLMLNVYRPEKRKVTYCDWSKKDRSPETFTELSTPLLSAARIEGCLFLRKLKVPLLDDSSSCMKRRLDEANNFDEKKLEMLSSWIQLVLGLSVGSTDFELLMEASRLIIREEYDKNEVRHKDQRTAPVVRERATSVLQSDMVEGWGQNDRDSNFQRGDSVRRSSTNRYRHSDREEHRDYSKHSHDRYRHANMDYSRDRNDR